MSCCSSRRISNVILFIFIRFDLKGREIGSVMRKGGLSTKSKFWIFLRKWGSEIFKMNFFWGLGFLWFLLKFSILKSSSFFKCVTNLRMIYTNMYVKVSLLLWFYLSIETRSLGSFIIGLRNSQYKVKDLHHF